jgi:hypothetical protein
MSSFIPAWIIGGPFIGLLILAFSFKGPSAMGGGLPRDVPRRNDRTLDRSAPLLDPVHPESPRRPV